MIFGGEYNIIQCQLAMKRCALRNIEGDEPDESDEQMDSRPN